MSTEWLPSLWLDILQDLLEEDTELDYGDQWNLNFNYRQTDTVTNEERKRGWKAYNHCAYGKFRCGGCSKTWTSARVMVLFRYRLRSEVGKGTVIMRPFGQACRSCPDDQFYLPGFSEEEVEGTLLKLFSKIRKNCYGEDEYDVSTRSDEVKKTKPHEKSLCEACRMGICCQK